MKYASDYRLLKKRNAFGFGISVITLLIACLAILPLSLLGFEMVRFGVMQQQLRNITDAAALAGSAALANAPTGYTVTQAEQLAMQVAVQTFEQNSILQTNFSTTNVTANQNTGTALNAPTTPYQAVVNITLLDQNGNVQSTGSTSAKVMQVQAYYSDSPMFASFLPIQTLEVANAISNGGLPQLDVILCFDVSGSMDDQTNVYLINRYWNGSQVTYSNVASGTIYNIFGPPSTGSRVDATWPQQLTDGAYDSPTNANPYIFSEGQYPNNITTQGLRADSGQYAAGTLVPEQGMPPGNYDKNNPASSTGHGIHPNTYANGYTDLVVDVGASSSGVVSGFSFPNRYVALEASRGNLESAAVFNQSKGGAAATTNANLSGITPTAGYYNAYWLAVQSQSQPIAAARQSAVNFFTTMNLSSNAHFGLVAFADNAGTSANDTWSTTNNNIDLGYANGGTSSFPNPLIALNQSQTNYTNIVSAISGTSGFGVPGGSGSTGTLPLGPTGATNIADALSTAITELTDSTKYRSQAKKAIVLFTDGIPSAPANAAAPDYGSYSQATTAGNDGIPIYTIGLSQNAAIVGQQNAILGDGNNGSGQGIAYLSGHGAIYIQVSSINNLDQAFQAIARTLVVIQ